MEKQGFEVTRHYLLETAWVAKYTRGSGGRTLGVNSEMDALPGIGHACGHNLIAIAGVAVACGVKAALDKYDIAGSIVLLGTPGRTCLADQAHVTLFDALICVQVKREVREKRRKKGHLVLYRCWCFNRRIGCVQFSCFHVFLVVIEQLRVVSTSH